MRMADAGEILSGALGGAVGGVAMLGVADELARLGGHGVIDVVRLALQPLRPAALSSDQLTWSVAAAIGAMIGIPIVWGMRHVARTVARLLFATILGPLLWTLAHAFLLLRLIPTVGRELPFPAMALGAVAFGVCVGLVPPIGARSQRIAISFDADR